MKIKKLTDLDIDEVSLVKNPANKTPFLFLKSTVNHINLVKGDTSFTITSDGTYGGTSLVVGGQAVEDVKSLNFFVYKPEDQDSDMYPELCSPSTVSLYYETTETTEDGFMVSKRHTLIEPVKESESMDVQKELDTISQYIDSLPTVAREALDSMKEKTKEKMMEITKTEAVVDTPAPKTPVPPQEPPVDVAKLVAEAVKGTVEAVIKPLQDEIASLKESQKVVTPEPAKTDDDELVDVDLEALKAEAEAELDN